MQSTVWNSTINWSNFFYRWTVLRFGRDLCRGTDWLSRSSTNRRSVAPEDTSSEQSLAGSCVTPSVTSLRSCLSTRSWAFRLHTAKWLYLSTLQAPLCSLSLQSAATLRGCKRCTGRTRQSNTRMLQLSSPKALCSLPAYITGKGGHFKKGSCFIFFVWMSWGLWCTRYFFFFFYHDHWRMFWTLDTNHPDTAANVKLKRQSLNSVHLTRAVK